MGVCTRRHSLYKLTRFKAHISRAKGQPLRGVWARRGRRLRQLPSLALILHLGISSSNLLLPPYPFLCLNRKIQCLNLTLLTNCRAVTVLLSSPKKELSSAVNSSMIGALSLFQPTICHSPRSTPAFGVSHSHGVSSELDRARLLATSLGHTPLQSLVLCLLTTGECIRSLLQSSRVITQAAAEISLNE